MKKLNFPHASFRFSNEVTFTSALVLLGYFFLLIQIGGRPLYICGTRLKQTKSYTTMDFKA